MGRPAIASIGVSPSEDNLAVTTDTRQLYRVGLGGADAAPRSDGGAGLFEPIGAQSHALGPPMVRGGAGVSVSAAVTGCGQSVM
jgi:hypothetical protein